ncbi:MAG: 30S ribosomal protein S20 [Alphaproteobacteria bacterium]|nr:30S ribosomal protein S20 [Alphaproteobacteria bacterium]|tara:strand:- start:224 stop:487 length:264 start_codon:yes stop_codon:yes gene_type:complete
MAHTRQAKKRIRQDASRTEVNRTRVSRIRTYTRKVEEALSAGDQDAALKAFREMQPEFHKGASKGVFHKNTVARKLSRISKKIKTLG